MLGGIELDWDRKRRFSLVGQGRAGYDRGHTAARPSVEPPWLPDEPQPLMERP
jgi:hypothetical protein